MFSFMQYVQRTLEIAKFSSKLERHIVGLAAMRMLVLKVKRIVDSLMVVLKHTKCGFTHGCTETDIVCGFTDGCTESDMDCGFTDGFTESDTKCGFTDGCTESDTDCGFTDGCTESDTNCGFVDGCTETDAECGFTDANFWSAASNTST
jgi:hypothetical protein